MAISQQVNSRVFSGDCVNYKLLFALIWNLKMFKGESALGQKHAFETNILLTGKTQDLWQSLQECQQVYEILLK